MKDPRSSGTPSSRADRHDRLVEHDIQRKGIRDAPIVTKRLQPRRLVVRADERHAPDLHQLGSREEHHLRRVMQERIDQRSLLDDLVGQSSLHSGDSRSQSGWPGADYQHVTQNHRHEPSCEPSSEPSFEPTCEPLSEPCLNPVVSAPSATCASRRSPSSRAAR